MTKEPAFRTEPLGWDWRAHEHAQSGAFPFRSASARVYSVGASPDVSLLLPEALIPVWRNLGLKKSGTHSPLQAVAGLELWPGCPGTSVGRPRSQPVYELAAWERSREVSEGFEYCRKKHHRLANG